MTTPVASASATTSVRITAFASFVGTTIEWYDFFLYGTAAALVFNRVFFPSFDPLTGVLAAYATYAVGFIARPLGAVVFGHYGDRVGRKSMLVLTLLIMGISTFLIGLLPTYEQIGLWAAVALVLLRLAQGFGVGGEWGGAVLMAVEHAPPGARGFYGSWPQIGVPAGLLLSTAVFAVFARMPEREFLSWGWRVPFLLSLALVGVGLAIRLKILETPVFLAIKTTGREANRPILEVIRRYPRAVLIAMGARMAENGSFYIYSVFALTYATAHAHVDRAVVLNALLIACACDFVAIPFFGALSDRVGRRPVYLAGAIVTALFSYPFFWLLDSAATPLVTAALVIALTLSHAPMYAPQAAFFSELFGTSVRYTGASLGSQIASVIAGGFSPIIATALLPDYGRVGLSIYIAGLALVTIVAVLLARETGRTAMSDF